MPVFIVTYGRFYPFDTNLNSKLEFEFEFEFIFNKRPRFTILGRDGSGWLNSYIY